MLLVKICNDGKCISGNVVSNKIIIFSKETYATQNNLYDCKYF